MLKDLTISLTKTPSQIFPCEICNIFLENLFHKTPSGDSLSQLLSKKDDNIDNNRYQSLLSLNCSSSHLSPYIPWQISHTKWEYPSLFGFSCLGIDRKKTFVWGFMTKRCSWKLTLQNWQENICAGETPVPGVFLCVQDFAKHFFFRTLLDDYFWQNNFGNQVLYKKILFNLKFGLSPSKKIVLFTSMKTH